MGSETEAIWREGKRVEKRNSFMCFLSSTHSDSCVIDRREGDDGESKEEMGDMKEEKNPFVIASRFLSCSRHSLPTSLIP